MSKTLRERLREEAEWYNIHQGQDFSDEDVREQQETRELLLEAESQLSALEADAQRLVDAAIYTDSYGVSGSDFRACRICDHSNQPGLNARADWHPETCAAKQMEIALSVGQQEKIPPP